MISHLSDDLANRSTIAFCQRLSAAKDEAVKPVARPLSIRLKRPSVSPGDIKASRVALFKFETIQIFRADGTIEHYPAETTA